MSREEDLEAIEDTVKATMTGYLLRRAVLSCSVSLGLAALELATFILGVVGVFFLDGWWFGAGLGILAAILTFRVWLTVVAIRRRPERPAAWWGVVTKIASLPVNALGVPALLGWMPLAAAITVPSVLMVAEIGAWLLVRGRFSDELRDIRKFAEDNDSPRTWEV